MAASGVRWARARTRLASGGEGEGCGGVRGRAGAGAGLAIVRIWLRSDDRTETLVARAIRSRRRLNQEGRRRKGSRGVHKKNVTLSLFLLVEIEISF